MIKEISVEELKQKIDNNESFTFLDVREMHEAYISNIDIETAQIPLDDLRSRLDELSREVEIIAMCRSGNRSAQACKLLQEEGFSNVANLKGGINEWAAKIDPGLPQY